jgi:hypothetical protein
VRQFVEQHQRLRVRGAKGQRCVEVEFPQHAIAVRHCLERQPRQPPGHGLGVGAAMRLDHADHERQALRLRDVRGGQHRPSLAHARRSAEKYLQPPAPRMLLFSLHALQQGIGIGAFGRIRHGSRISTRRFTTIRRA